MKALFIWKVPKHLQEYLLKHIPKEIELIFPESDEPDLLVELAKSNQVDILVGWRPTKQLLEASSKLKLFQNPGAGVQHLIELFRKYEVKLANCHGNSYFTAQHGVALLLALSNTIIIHDRAVREGQWRNDLGVRENIPLRNINIGILGFGHVGSKVAKFLSGFDCNIIACKRSNLDENYSFVNKVYGYDKIEEFFQASDIIVSTLPSTNETQGLVDMRKLELLGQNGLIVNIGRGDTFNEKDLYDALEQNTIAGAALDVFWDEANPHIKESKIYPYTLPFENLGNVVLSPHRAASPMSDLKRWDPVVKNITNLYHNKELINLIDLESGY